ncbi:hypothetical protein PT974_06010 [Cladobotryum mycophilum]|uniref:DUF7514 domain-containing protein n=1 Tax=Cladobotryum mycophilum TaxID=491253 RepID=A0ABR0SLB4_9HYPO
MVFRKLVVGIGRQVRNSIVNGVQQHQEQQQQQQHQQYSNMNNNTHQNMYGPPPQLGRAAPNSTPASWGLLILPDKVTPSPLFARLIDAIFTLALGADTSNNADILTPTRLAAVYDELGYPQQDNLPFLLHRQAQNLGGGDPHKTVNEGMEMAWRLFELEYTTIINTSGLTVPGLTREGFRAMMVRDGLIYPPGQASAHSALLARHRGTLLTTQGAAFPAVPIGAESLMPPGVPATGDAETQRVYKERQAAWTKEYASRFGGQGMGTEMGMGMGMAPDMNGGGWQMAMQMQNFKHNMTMDAMTPGYRVPNGMGGYTYHYTGGLNW